MMISPLDPARPEHSAGRQWKPARNWVSVVGRVMLTALMDKQYVFIDKRQYHTSKNNKNLAVDRLERED
jgi:hypothetical protein